jgi:hypothetical protein
MSGMAFATAAAFEDFGSFILSDHPLHLQQQLVFWRLSECPVEKNDFNASGTGLVKDGS